MDKFIGRDYADMPFEIFSPGHLFILALIAAINILLVFRFKRTSGLNVTNTLRKSFAFLLIGLEVLFTIWSIYVGDWSLDYALPLHLCDAAILAAAAMLLTKNRLIYEVAYFWVLGGCTQALLTPDVGFDFPHFMFFYFFIGHGAVITAVLYMTFAEGYRPYPASLGRVFLLTNAYMLLVAAVNLLTGGNYLFLCHKPGNSSVLDLMGPWPWYILVLELVTMAVFLICYLPFLLGDSLKRRSRHAMDRSKSQRGIGF